jgi:hypothetical protein
LDENGSKLSVANGSFSNGNFQDLFDLIPVVWLKIAKDVHPTTIGKQYCKRLVHPTENKIAKDLYTPPLSENARGSCPQYPRELKGRNYLRNATTPCSFKATTSRGKEARQQRWDEERQQRWSSSKELQSR